MTENQLIDRVVAYVRKHSLRVPNPDYRATHSYAPQWRITGAVYWYQLPHGGPVIAARNSRTHRCVFERRGIDLGTLRELGVL